MVNDKNPTRYNLEQVEVCITNINYQASEKSGAFTFKHKHNYGSRRIYHKTKR